MEATTVSESSTERVQNIHNCYFENKLLHTFIVDHLLAKLNSSKLSIRSCLSPIDKGWLPYYARYLKPSDIDGKELLCIPLCDGVHFQEYIIDVTKRSIVYIDSLLWKTADNPTARKIAKIFFKDQDVTFQSLFSGRRQFDSNSCGMWLVSAIASFLIGIPEITRKSETLDICYSLLERTSPNLPEPNETPITLSGLNLINCEDHIKAFSPTDFLMRTLKSPEISDYFKKTPPKGIRTNLFYVTDRSQTSMTDILTDDNEAYLKSRSNKKSYYCADRKVDIVYEENNKYYYNMRQFSKSYSKTYVEPDNVIALKRIYGKATVTTISSPANGPESPAVAVLYQTTENIADAKCLPHGNTKKANAKSYFRTSKDVLKNTKQKLNSGLNPKKVYDKINDESGGSL